MIVSDDTTRLTPVHPMIHALLRRLNAAAVPDANIGCIMALGTHRYMTTDEIRTEVGAAVFEPVRVFNHEWPDQQVLVDSGTSTHGTPLLVNRAVVDADVVIGLGAIVLANPHPCDLLPGRPPYQRCRLCTRHRLGHGPGEGVGDQLLARHLCRTKGGTGAHPRPYPRMGDR